MLDPGDVIFAEELSWTSQGKQRVRFDRGWTSTEGVIGPLLMVMSDEASSPAGASMPRVVMNGHTSPASPVDSPTGRPIFRQTACEHMYTQRHSTPARYWSSLTDCL